MDDFTSLGADDFDFDRDQLLQNELGKNEKLLWSGRPRSRRALWATLPIVLFGIPWTLFSLFWVGMAIGMPMMAPAGHGPPVAVRIIFPLFGLPFVLVGLGMLSTPYWLGRRMKKTTYAVTTERVLILEPSWFGRALNVTSLGPEQLDALTKTVHPDGSGDLQLTGPFIGPYTNRGSYRAARAFYGIPDVNEVERIIRTQLLLHKSV